MTFLFVKGRTHLRIYRWFFFFIHEKAFYDSMSIFGDFISALMVFLFSLLLLKGFYVALTSRIMNIIHLLKHQTMYYYKK